MFCLKAGWVSLPYSNLLLSVCSLLQTVLFTEKHPGAERPCVCVIVGGKNGERWSCQFCCILTPKSDIYNWCFWICEMFCHQASFQQLEKKCHVINLRLDISSTSINWLHQQPNGPRDADYITKSCWEILLRAKCLCQVRNEVLL